MEHDPVDVTGTGADVDLTVRGVAADVVQRSGLPSRERTVGDQLLDQRLGLRTEEPAEVVLRQGELACRAAQMRSHHVRVARVDHGVLGRPVEQLLVMLREVLVERVVLRHEDGERLGLATPRSARLLPHRRSGPGIARQHGGVERADVHPELERARGRDREQLAVRELPLDRAAVLGEVAGPVALDPCSHPWVGEPTTGELGEQLGSTPAPREPDRARAKVDEPGHRPRRFGQRAPSRPGLVIDHRRVPEREELPAARRGVAFDDLDVQSGEASGELCRVPDGGGCEAPARLAAVHRDQPPEPAQDHRDLGAEDPAQHVRLVDHHERQAEEEVGPPGVIGEQRRMEHVGVGQHEVRAPPDQWALRPRRIPVVHRGLELRELERPDGPELVAREGLRREQEQRGGLGDRERGLRERHLVHERLAAGGAGGKHHVTPVRQRRQSFGLVRIEPVDAEQAEASDQHLRETRGERLHEGWSCGEFLYVHQRPVDLGIGGQVIEERLRVHRPRLRGSGDVTRPAISERRPDRWSPPRGSSVARP